MSGRQSSGLTFLAASDGQIVAPPSRPLSRFMIAISSDSSIGDRFFARHDFEQYLTESQSRTHFFLHSISRPQTTQVFGGG